VKLAIDKVRSKWMSVREAADTFSVPGRSLGDRLTKLQKNCLSCGGWAHENCADTDGNILYYKCDFCKIH
jgi:hypothetical protein